MRAVDLKNPEELLRLGYGLVAITAGADKFTNLLVDWDRYLSPLARRTLPVRPATFMKLVGVVEMAVGLTILTRWKKRGAYAASAWLAAITANLVSTGKYLDIAARDALLSLGAYAFGRLEQEQEQALGKRPGAGEMRRAPLPERRRVRVEPTAEQQPVLH